MHVWYETARDTLRTRRLRDKVKLWFSSPGWRPDDLPPWADDWQRPKYDPQTPPGAGPVVFVQYWIVTVAALALIVMAGDLPRTFVLTGVAVLGYSFFVQGAFLEGRRYAPALEAVRTVLVAAAAWFWHPLLGTPLPTVIMAYGAVSLLAALRVASPRSEPPALWTSGQS